MRILLADDQPVVRYALRVLLERQLDLAVVGEAADAASLLSEIESKGADLILLDWPLPGAVPAKLVSTLRQVRPMVPVIALSGRPEAAESAQAAGVDVFVCKGDPPEVLLCAIRKYGRPTTSSLEGSQWPLQPIWQSAA